MVQPIGMLGAITLNNKTLTFLLQAMLTNYLITISKMKKQFILFLFVSYFFIGCCNNPEIMTYRFNETEKEYVPYKLNETVMFITSETETLKGSISEINARTETSDRGNCTEIIYEKITSQIRLNNLETFYITLTKSDLSTPFVISYTKDGFQMDYTTKYKDFSEIKFSNISFNNLSFENAILFNTHNENGEIISNIVYSKTNGIEFILFEDGTWYKRVE